MVKGITWPFWCLSHWNVLAIGMTQLSFCHQDQHFVIKINILSSRSTFCIKINILSSRLIFLSSRSIFCIKINILSSRSISYCQNQIVHNQINILSSRSTFCHIDEHFVITINISPNQHYVTKSTLYQQINIMSPN